MKNSPKNRRKLSRIQRGVVFGSVLLFAIQLMGVYQSAVPISYGLNYRREFNTKYRPFLTDITKGTNLIPDDSQLSLVAKDPLELNPLETDSARLRVYTITLNSMIQDDKQHYTKLPYVFTRFSPYDDMQNSHRIISGSYPQVITLINEHAELLEYVAIFNTTTEKFSKALESLNKVGGIDEFITQLEASAAGLDAVLVEASAATPAAAYKAQFASIPVQVARVRDIEKQAAAHYRSGNFEAYNATLQPLEISILDINDNLQNQANLLNQALGQNMTKAIAILRELVI